MIQKFRIIRSLIVEKSNKGLKMDTICHSIAQELKVNLQQVKSAVGLLDEGATVPFIARYRKEVTGGLDDTQLRTLEERLRYLRELEERRNVIIKNIEEQGKLSDALRTELLEADSKTRLEDLYLPYKPKRRTKGQIAIEAGLEPLANQLLDNPSLDPDTLATDFLNAEHQITDSKAALDGAKYILMERFAENAGLLARIRDYLWDNGILQSAVLSGKESEGAKFSDYFEYHEALKDIPSHRALALFRGRNEGVLQLSIAANDDLRLDAKAYNPCEGMIAEQFSLRDQGRAADKWLQTVVQWTWRIKILTHMETELMSRVRESAETEAIRVFAKNLKDLLMAAPAGNRPTLGLDPGIRTGVKVTVVDETGKLVAHTTVFPHPPQNQWDKAKRTLANLCKQHKVELVSIGNGTGSRETDKLVAEMLQSDTELNLQKIMVNEAGASIYSASEFAAKEFPDLDVSLRGAVSIARRLQDPLAELVKIEPKSIGVGQYQHDVSQTQLARSLDAVVEDCVNAVGVDLNTASAPLLARVSGLNTTIAKNIVEFREQNGRFNSRNELKNVPRLGAKTFELAAGFLRILNGNNPLDSSAVHPEAYPIVERISTLKQRNISDVIGDGQFLKQLDPAEFTDEKFGLPTVIDILKELDKPGRDPRPEFKTAQFKEGVESLADLKQGMILEGVATNVTNFGAFIDIGVHQDGLVHISAMTDKFIKDPSEVIKTGDIVKVKVMEVDIARKRISLSMRLDDAVAPAAKATAGDAAQKGKNNPRNAAPRAKTQRSQQAPANNALGEALLAAMSKNK